MSSVTRSQTSAAPFTLTVASRQTRKNKATSSAFPLIIQLNTDQPTLKQLKSAIHQKHAGLTAERQRITTEEKKALLDEDKRLTEAGVRNGDTLYVKDIGPQVAWRTVFLAEYGGPLIINPLLYFAAPRIWGAYEPSRMQALSTTLVTLHYLKREYETIFVHRFSNATMPILNLFMNTAYYSFLSGIFLSGSINIPANSAAKLKGTLRDSDAWLIGCTVAWLAFETLNYSTHIALRNLRPAGTRERKIPRGGLFEYVSCPNYFYEILGWVAISALTLSPAAALFSVAGVFIMTNWALGKHRNYRKEFKDYPRKRKALWPFLV
ncbi:Steroid reductase required for elongation of the very long chain fatty acids [Ceraceosorus bombacis]|uniref:Steroid reductase required for elongation of the very long chain fatty acids n=1 Tax=Ceraceosorus bombacis TaxID=401625 RepID=A0A0P1BKM8_9BASI|nr:Steroid reductase required for elongation of the very long chain fatty acids [Ceraceosorus bombacis]